MKRPLCTAALLLGTLTLTASAQNGYRCPVERTPDGPRYGDPLQEVANVREVSHATAVTPRVKQSLKGRVVRVNAAGQHLVVDEEESGRRFLIPLTDRTKLKADKEAGLAGRPRLSLADFKPGRIVKVIYRSPGPNVLEVRLLRPKS